MKILYINSVYGRGSTGNIVRTLHLNNLSNGIDSFVCFGRGNKTNDKNVYKISNEFLSKINVIRSKITGMVYSGNFIATQRLIKLIKKIKPDIIHIHNLNDQYVNEYKLLSFIGKCKIKTIITLHSEQMYTGSCGYCFDCNAWKKDGCIRCPYLKQSTGSKHDATKKAFKKLLKSYQYFDKNQLVFASVSNWILNRAMESTLLKEYSNSLIRNGVSKDFCLNNQKHYLGDLDNNFVLFINPRMLDKNKGYQFIAPIFEKIKSKMSLVVVGDNSDIETVEGVKYLGPIYEKNKLAALYSNAKLTLLLSKKESYSMIIAESLSCGTPVVSFECGGPTGTFDDKFVKFIEYGDIDKLVDILLSFSCDRNEVAEYAKKNLSEKTMMESYKKLYEDLL